jgi:hypothetical protein
MRLLVLFVAGCVIRTDITHVALRDPSQIAVADILPIGSARGEIPESVPPYIGSAERGSWVERGSDAATIDAWCPQCVTWRRRRIVAGPTIDLAGSASELLAFDGDQLRARYVFEAGWPCSRHRRRTCLEPKIALELVTPLSNVASIDYERRLQSPDHDGDLGGLIFAAVYASGGAALGGLGLHDHERAFDYTGAGMIAVAAVVFAFTMHDLLATDEHTRIAIP